jgi:hypothetical protein
MCRCTVLLAIWPKDAVVCHNSVNNTTLKINNLFEKNNKLKMNNNNNSINLVNDKKLIDIKFKSSYSLDLKKCNSENEKIANKYIFGQLGKKSENSIDKIYKEKTEYNNKNRNKLKYFMSYSNKVRKIINENMNKKINNNIRNDSKLMNSNQKKNNFFFTINKTIIHNMNNTFNNSNHNKHCLSNINNSKEVLDNRAQYSPYLPKTYMGKNSTNS